MKHGTTNQVKKNLIMELRKTKSNAWKYVSELLGKAKRKAVVVNLWKIEKYAQEGKIIVVPGKVLGVGELTKKNDIAAFIFSESAKTKLGKKAITIKEALAKDKTGKNIQVLI